MRALSDALRRAVPSILEETPPDRCIEAMDRVDVYDAFAATGARAQQYTENIQRAGGATALVLYHKLVLLRLIAQFEVRLKTTPLSLPEETISEYRDVFERVMGEMERNDDAFYDFSNELFTRDLGYCRLRLIPIQPLVASVSGVPRGILGKGGVRQAWRIVTALGLPIKPYRPYLAVHINPRRLREFKPEPWNESYRKLAAILELNPDVRGMMRGNWLLDPAIVEFSPKLAFVREGPMQGGARLFYAGTDSDVVREALAKSATRRRAFDEGRYTPKNFYIVWNREELLKWAASPRQGNPVGPH